jgi:hypothetical protein
MLLADMRNQFHGGSTKLVVAVRTPVMLDRREWELQPDDASRRELIRVRLTTRLEQLLGELK